MHTCSPEAYQSLYNHYMLQLHNKMKEDIHYQKNVVQQAMQFSAGSSWIVCTDQVSHAVDSGQYVLEQTFYLPVADIPIAIEKEKLAELNLEM